MSSNTTPFPFCDEIRVRFRDVDAMGHVNNAVYFTYMETARSVLFQQFFDIKRPMDIPVILGETSCRYLAPVYLGETVRVWMGISRFGTKSFDIVYRLEGGDGRLVATGHSTMVMYDYEQGRTVPVPESFKDAVRAAQGDWSPPA
ncbi:MAG: acyl-CoA thioesterase [Chloroflexi bacterium]|nr:acyl-CoA thioesterase [Chloroflexota bacterium]